MERGREEGEGKEGRELEAERDLGSSILERGKDEQ